MSPCLVFCPICKNEFNWHQGYGRKDGIRCCNKECYEESELRLALSLLSKEYEKKSVLN